MTACGNRTSITEATVKDAAEAGTERSALDSGRVVFDPIPPDYSMVAEWYAESGASPSDYLAHFARGRADSFYIFITNAPDAEAQFLARLLETSPVEQSDERALYLVRANTPESVGVGWYDESLFVYVVAPQSFDLASRVAESLAPA
jgi:hypothetical protein